MSAPVGDSTNGMGGSALFSPVNQRLNLKLWTHLLIHTSKMLTKSCSICWENLC